MAAMTRLNGAHALVTGGAQGIGLATVKRLLSAGAIVTIWDLSQEALDKAHHELEESNPGTANRTHLDVCDVTDFSAVRNCFDRAERRAPIDILINNAGYLSGGTYDQQPFDRWQKTIDVNLTAVMHLSHLAVQGMYNRAKGHIVNISSASGMIGVPGLTAYSASKWAVWGFTEALRAEARAHGIQVSSVHPSYIATGMFAGARLSGLGNLMVPQLKDHDVVARAIVDGILKKGKNMVLRPRSVRLTPFLRGILPDRAFQWLARNLGVWDSMSGWRGRETGPSGPIENG